MKSIGKRLLCSAVAFSMTLAANLTLRTNANAAQTYEGEAFEAENYTSSTAFDEAASGGAYAISGAGVRFTNIPTDLGGKYTLTVRYSADNEVPETKSMKVVVNSTAYTVSGISMQAANGWVTQDFSIEGLKLAGNTVEFPIDENFNSAIAIDCISLSKVIHLEAESTSATSEAYSAAETADANDVTFTRASAEPEFIFNSDAGTYTVKIRYAKYNFDNPTYYSLNYADNVQFSTPVTTYRNKTPKDKFKFETIEIKNITLESGENNFMLSGATEAFIDWIEFIPDGIDTPHIQSETGLVRIEAENASTGLIAGKKAGERIDSEGNKATLVWPQPSGLGFNFYADEGSYNIKIRYASYNFYNNITVKLNGTDIYNNTVVPTYYTAAGTNPVMKELTVGNGVRLNQGLNTLSITSGDQVFLDYIEVADSIPRINFSQGTVRLEAENSIGAVAELDHPDKVRRGATFKVNSLTEGDFMLFINYRLYGSNWRNVSVKINDASVFNTYMTCTGKSYTTLGVPTKIHLNIGLNTIEVSCPYTEFLFDYIEVMPPYNLASDGNLFINAENRTPAYTQNYNAEYATPVTYSDNTSDLLAYTNESIDYIVNANEAGVYTLTIKWGEAFSNANQKIEVNSETIFSGIIEGGSNIGNPKNSEVNSTETKETVCNINLVKGINTVKVSGTQTIYDYLKIETPSDPPVTDESVKGYYSIEYIDAQGNTVTSDNAVKMLCTCNVENYLGVDSLMFAGAFYDLDGVITRLEKTVSDKSALSFEIADAATYLAAGNSFKLFLWERSSLKPITLEVFTEEDL